MIDSYNPDLSSNASQLKKHDEELRIIQKHNRELYERLKNAVRTKSFFKKRF